jgi:hypothetical protein
VTSSNSVASPSPIPLVLQRLGSSIVLSWTNAAFSLQSAPTMNSIFTDVPSASSPYTNLITGTARFFRLKAN